MAYPHRPVIFQTRGKQHGPITRLVSPSDLGQLLKPFVFLDLFDAPPDSFGGFGLHPHSGIATLTVLLGKGEVWRYQPEPGHTVAWMAVHAGAIQVPAPVASGELAVFEASQAPIDFHSDAGGAFVFGAALSHPHDLVTGSYSVHTNRDALQRGEAEIHRIGHGLRVAGRLG